MADSRSRMLRLLSLLQTHRHWSGEELADRLAVSPRTVRRDVDRLRELGYPVRATRGVAGGYQLEAGASLPPLLLEDEEAVAIAAGLSTAAANAAAGHEEAALRALSKIVQVMPAPLRRRVAAIGDYTVPVVFPGPVVDPSVLASLAQACRDDERVHFSYTARDASPTDRRVEPHRLVTVGRRWYLVGYDLDRQDWRTFRVDRLADPRLTGVRFRQRTLPAADAAAYVRESLDAARTHIAVEVRVRAPADELLPKVGRWASVTPTGPGSCTLRMDVDALDWPILLLGSIDADFEVVAPPELVGRLRSVADRFARCVDGGTGAIMAP